MVVVLLYLKEVFALKIRIKFTKTGSLKFIGHLDVMRYFQKLNRRAGIDMKYSQGFNPHPVMTVAMPLSVGVTSDCEYLKVGFLDEFSPEEIKEKINAAFPDGFEILEITKLFGKEIDFSKIDKAEYIAEFELLEGDDIDIKAFLEFCEIKVMKKSKSGIKESDIKPYIYSIDKLSQDKNTVTLKMCLACGSLYNLKPDTVSDAFEKYLNLKIGFVSVHRNKLIFSE